MNEQENKPSPREANVVIGYLLARVDTFEFEGKFGEDELRAWLKWQRSELNK